MNTAVDSNPLVNYRKKDRPEDGHFTTQREEVCNDGGALSIYPGEFKYIKDPALEVDLALWEDNGDTKSISTYLKMTGRDGYQVARADEWEVAERLQLAWKSDVSKRLTFGGMDKHTMVLMWRTGESADAARERSLKWSNDVHKTAEEKEAEMRGKLAPLGATVYTSLEDDDGTDEAAKAPRKRRT